MWWYVGDTILGHKSGPKGVGNDINRHLLRVNRLFFSQLERKCYVSSLRRGNQALPGGQKWGEMVPKC